MSSPRSGPAGPLEVNRSIQRAMTRLAVPRTRMAAADTSLVIPTARQHRMPDARVSWGQSEGTAKNPRTSLMERIR